MIYIDYGKKMDWEKIAYEIEFERRRLAAEDGYMTLSELCELFGISKQEYVRRFLQTMPPMTWTSSTTVGASND